MFVWRRRMAGLRAMPVAYRASVAASGEKNRSCQGGSPGSCGTVSAGRHVYPDAREDVHTCIVVYTVNNVIVMKLEAVAGLVLLLHSCPACVQARAGCRGWARAVERQQACGLCCVGSQAEVAP